MKNLLEKQKVFNATLKVLAFFARRPYFDSITQSLTTQAARLNVVLNRPQHATGPQALGTTWQEMMPPDGQAYFPITQITEDTAYTEIHLHCPLQGTGDVAACHKLMNYDRKLMEAVGGQLIVLESQSNSGQSYCKLAIRAIDAPVDDLIPAHR